jgi:hypothetical protein
MDISIKRVKSSPYKLVVSSNKVVGLFESGKYIALENFNEKHIDVALEYVNDGETHARV